MTRAEARTSLLGVANTIAGLKYHVSAVLDDPTLKPEMAEREHLHTILAQFDTVRSSILAWSRIR